MTDDFWTGTGHKGFNFNEDDDHFLQPNLSVLKNDDSLSHLDLLKCDGLNETAENEPRAKSFAFADFSSFAPDPQELFSAKLTKKHDDTLDFQLKTKCAKAGKLTPSGTVKNIVLGLNYTLEPHKGRKEKIELLEEAVKSHDGNAIITVVLFLRSTLKKSIFQKEILAFCDATNMYLSYLEDVREFDELINMLLLMGKSEEAAMLKYKTSIIVGQPENKLKWLKNCLSTHFQPGSIGEFIRNVVKEHQNILSEQLIIQNILSEKISNKEVNLQLLEKLTGNINIVDSSVMTTVILSILCHNLLQNSDFNTHSIKERYHFTERQYTWAAVRTLALLKRWDEIENLFTSKNWLREKKMKCCIGYSRVLEVLSTENAPPEILSKYVCCIESEDEKLNAAKKYKCHTIVIEVLKSARDKQGLLDYKSSVPVESAEYYTIAHVLKNSVIRWKN